MNNMIECCKCKKTKTFSDFYKRKCKRGYSYICKECDKLRVLKYQTSDGYWVIMLNNAKNHSKSRKEKGRIEAGICNLTITDLENKWNIQNGECYYSDIKISKERHSDWSCSLERLNNSLGYTINNTVLICQEFNTAITQWNIDKINNIPKLLNKKFELLDSNLNLTKRNITTRNQDNKIINNIEYGYCRYCKNYIPLDKLHVNFKKRGCSTCVQDYSKNKKSTLSGYLSSLVTYSRRNKLKMTHDITLDFLKELYITQNGKCAYSGLQLLLPSNNNNDWVMSLERINTSIGYITTNVCLICREFNSMDRSTLSNKISGSCGWNKKKFQQFLSTKKFI